MKQICMLVVCIFILSLSAFAGPGDTDMAQNNEIIRARFVASTDKLVKQESTSLLVEIVIDEEWHINSNSPLEQFLIPTEIKFDEINGITFGKIDYMQPELRKFSFSDTKMSVYEGKVYAHTTVTVSPDIDQEEIKLSGTVYYQACNDQSCLAPNQYRFAALIPIAESGVNPEKINEELFNAVRPQFVSAQKNGLEDEFSRVIRESSILYALIFIYLGGLALNLTPCVYPLIPITISYFGGQSEGNKQGLIFRAIVYVLGMSITYSVLGVLASLTGGLLGSALQNPLVLIFIAIVLVGLALSMFGLYEIRVPQSLAMLGGKNRAGYIGTFFMGLTVGLIAAPCIGPFVLGLLTYVSEVGDPVTGFWMFFILAMGLGTPFLILGIFSGAATRLPRSGAWMVWVRNIFGFVLIGMAIYFMEPLFPGQTVYLYTLGILAIFAGVYLGWIDKNKGNTGFMVSRYLVGVLFILLGIFFILPSNEESGDQITWQPYSAELIETAKSAGKPVIIDFYADWCIPCKELDKFTFSNGQVIAEAKNFVMLKSDLTHFQSEQSNLLRESFNIKGVPTIVFISKTGEEIKGKRLVGFEEADQFLKRMQDTIK